ncbi:unnamed protein product [Ilex paraguariensis]|uniref:Aminotransferase-like plant mobile domain-containing protein n=1 Tax=Ilex paraguariensis TaxID=185542 RepID=A0ABC8RR04_9AQUA
MYMVETHTFHLLIGEATVTLQDMSLLSELPIDGDAVTGVDTHHTMLEWQDYYDHHLGIRPLETALFGSRLKVTTLVAIFAEPLRDDVDVLTFCLSSGLILFQTSCITMLGLCTYSILRT